MEIGGHWDDRIEGLLAELDVPHGKLHKHLEGLGSGPVKKAAIQLHSDVSAIFTFIARYCRDNEACSAQIVAAVLRMLIESAVSVFAFCQDPKNREHRARLYLNYAAVYDFRFACLDEANFGCPWDEGDPHERQRILSRKAKAQANLAEHAVDYLRKKPKSGQTAEDLAKEALATGNERPQWFRLKWYPEARRDILRREGMEWIDDVLYKRFCSAVHSDVCASEILANLGRTNTFGLALQFWGAALYRLIEELNVGVSAQHKRLLRSYYMFLKGEA
jgi:hypothetical protein